MAQPFTTERDPRDWSLVITVFFLALCWWRLAIPSDVYFDEVHYVKAARAFLEGQRINAEHPMFGKAVLAASIHLLGDSPINWRIPSALLGALGLFAVGRMVWFASGRRLATLGAMFLLATNFFWFVHSRIAMLDMTMAALGMAGPALLRGVPPIGQTVLETGAICTKGQRHPGCKSGKVSA